MLAETTPDAKNNRLSDEIYNFFASNYGTRQTKKKKRRQEKHVKALNVATRLKNEARKELRQAKTNDAISPEEVMSLARKFFQVLRSHSQCKRAFQRTKRLKESRCARDECHKNFWPFTKQLLDGSSRSNVEPGFSKEEATQFFTHTYHADEREFVLPEWMPCPPTPTTAFRCDEITMDEIIRAVRKSKSKSAPCPLDNVPYVVFKKCPALLQGPL